MRSYRSRSWAAILVALVIAASMAGALSWPRQDFDLMAYVGVVRRYDASSDEEALSLTLADLRRELTPERFAWMTGQGHPDSYAHAMASDARSFGQQLRWFQGRPLFTRAAWALVRGGLTAPRALHLISALSSALLAAVFFMCTAALRRSWLRVAVWLGTCSVLDLASLAASPLADPLSALLVVSGLGLVLLWERPLPGLSLLVASVAARPDNVMYALALSAFLLGSRPIFAARALGPSAGASAAALVVWRWVDRESYGWAKLVHFRRVGLERYPAEALMPLSLAHYGRVLRAWALEVYTCEVVAALLWVLLLARFRSRLLSRPFVAFGVCMVPLSLARFLLFPDWHSRFFVAPLGIFFIAAAMVISPAPTRGSSPPTRRASRP